MVVALVQQQLHALCVIQQTIIFLTQPHLIANVSLFTIGT
jgi:hypothetical protein